MSDENAARCVLGRRAAGNGLSARPLRCALALVAVLLLALTACGSSEGSDSGSIVSGVTKSDNHGYHGAWLDTPYQPAAIPLEDTAGDPVSLDQPDAPLRLVFFGYTNCPDICQVVMSTMASALTKLTDEQRDQVQGVFVTTDPARDTPTVLREYLDRFDPTFVGLTGKLQTIIEVAKPMRVFIEKGEKLASGGYEVSHTTAVMAVQDGAVRVVWTQGTSPADMAEDIERLLKEQT